MASMNGVAWSTSSSRPYASVTSHPLVGILGKRIKWLILPLHESETDRHLIGLSG